MGYYTSMIVLIPAIILTVYAQNKVQRTYRIYAKIGNRLGMSGAEAARRILDLNGLGAMPIMRTQGVLTDNYNPIKKTMFLSEGVHDSPSIASIAIAAHESGHAIQHAQGYSLLKIRNSIVPVANIGSSLSWPLLVVGIMMGRGGEFFFNLGIILFLAVVVFHLVTLPVELDASKRALAQLEAAGVISGQDELSGAKNVLDAAALTYLAALSTSVATLLRMFLMRGRRD